MGKKDLALPQLHCRSKLQLRFNPWPGDSICHAVAKKEKKGDIIIIIIDLTNEIFLINYLFIFVFLF